MKHLIVGVDVGTTSAVAAVDLEGRLIHIISGKDFGVDEIVAKIRECGTPSLIATDVYPTPKSIKKIASSFGANTFTPKKDISIEDKIFLTKDFNPKNPHERDALAAALNAFRKKNNLLKKASSKGLSEVEKNKLLKGERLGITVADNKPEKSKKPKQKAIPASPQQKKIRRLEKQRSRLKTELEEKKEEIEALSKKIFLANTEFSLESKKEFELKRLKRRLDKRGRDIKTLKYEIKKFKQYRFLWNKIIQGDAIPVGVFPQTYGGLTIIPNKIKENEEEYFKDVEHVFTDNPTNKKSLDEKGVPHSTRKILKDFMGCYYVNKKDLDEAKKEKIKNIEELIEEYRQTRNT